MWWCGCPTPPCSHLTYFLHMVVALESFHSCLLAWCVAPPSSWATEDDPSYTISFLIFFASTRNPSSTNFVFKWYQPLVGKRNINLCQLVPSLPISTFLASCPWS
jgi:hypothetical protein